MDNIKEITKKIWRRLGRIYVMKIERMLIYNKWFNPLATLYLNLRCVPLRQAVKLPILVFGFPKLFSTFGHIRFPQGCFHGMVRFNESIGGGPQCECGNSELNLWGTLIFRGPCTIGTSNKLIIGEDGVMDIGSDTKIMALCNVVAYKRVVLGNNSWIVHRSQVMDTNFHYVANFQRGGVKQIARPITIGDYCWICNNSTISGGAHLPHKTIVASNSLVNKDMSDIPEESLIGGIPAKLLYTGIRRIDNVELERKIRQHFFENNSEYIYSFDDDVDHNICNKI